MKPRILYLATADARGHLMRAQLLSRALIERGAEVRVLTTSDEGATYLGEFGIAAALSTLLLVSSGLCVFGVLHFSKSKENAFV